MTAPGLVVAADQLAAGAVQVKNFRAHSLDRAHPGGETVRIEAPASNVHRDRRRSDAALATAVNEAVEQVCGKVVDDIPAHVLERVQDRRLARTGHAGDEQQARRASRPRLRHQNLRPIRSSASATFEGAEAVMASIVISGNETPRIGRCRESSGSRWISLVSSTSSATGTSVAISISTIPIPRISSLPAMFGGALATSRSP